MKYSRVFVLWLAVAANFSIANTVRAQTTDQTANKVDVDLFIGLGTSLPAMEDFAYKYALDYESGFGIVQFRLGGIHEGLRLFSDFPPETTTDVSVLYGLKVFEIGNQDEGEFSFRVLAGIGYTRIITKGELISEAAENIFGKKKYKKITETTVGFPYEVGIKNQSGKIGMKLVLVGNINKKDSYAGIVGGFFVELF